VTLEGAFDTLCTQLEQLRDVLRVARLTVSSGEGQAGSVLLVDQLAETVEELRGWGQEALTSALEARDAARHPVDVNGARQGLTRTQHRVNLLSQRFSAELASFHRIAELKRLGRGRTEVDRLGPELAAQWRAWSRATQDSIVCCQQPLFEINEALLACWQEMAERAGMNSVSVQTTSVGQQITVPPGSDMLSGTPT
jgi:hypothetical protein